MQHHILMFSSHAYIKVIFNLNFYRDDYLIRLISLTIRISCITDNNLVTRYTNWHLKPGTRCCIHGMKIIKTLGNTTFG